MIGDTSETAQGHYGMPSKMYKDVKGRVGVIYQTPAFIIMVQYLDGVSHNEVYAKHQDEAFSESEIDALMAGNGSGGRWQKGPDLESSYLIWVILETGTICSYGPTIIDDRQFQHSVSIGSHTYVQHNKMLDTLIAQQERGLTIKHPALIEGNGGPQTPFVIRSGNHGLSARYQNEIIHALWSPKKWVVNQRNYSASERGKPGNQDLCEWVITVDGQLTLVYFDLSEVTRIINDPDVKAAVQSMVDSIPKQTKAEIRSVTTKPSLPPLSKLSLKSVYITGYKITAFIIFVGSWIYCVASYGYLLGVGLGWLPSLIVAVIAGCIWPLIAAAIIVLIIVVMSHSTK